MLKKILGIAISFVCLLSFTSCLESRGAKEQNEQLYFKFADDFPKEVVLKKKPEKVVSLMGSYGEIWELSGGGISGITEDAISERNMQLKDDIKIIGTVKDPNMELILEMSPDFVMLSADVETHVKMDETLTSAGIPHAYFKVDTFSDYLRTLKTCSDINQKPENYQKYGEDIQIQIDLTIERVKKKNYNPKILLIRSMSTKAKALKDDHMVGIMLKDLGAENIASKYPSLLENLSMETIISEDPNIILVVPMGDYNKAINTLENGIASNPAWKELSAVKNERYHILPKELFQYKPNAKWGDSYEYLEKTLEFEQ